MAKRKKSSEVMPIVSMAHQQEDGSRIIFQQKIRPWMIINWFQRDYGIDANVEIQRSIADNTKQIATGKRFSMQLKSSGRTIVNRSTFSFTVDRDKIAYWFGSLEPVMLAYVDLNEEKVYYIWIDEDFIQNLHLQNQNWLAQDTISVHFLTERQINSSELKIIEKYVLNFKRPSRTIMTPGNYFRYSQEVKTIVEVLRETVSKFQINYLDKDLEVISKDCEKSIYTIAVVGPSRVGKSTLINSLCNKEISPVGILPTTGIPISIYPFNENKTTVIFKDGRTKTGPVDATFLNIYTTQNENPDNRKNVKYVTVNIINSMLEKGLSLCDVPGLDDPNTEIRSITKNAIYNVNAIVYVISVASYANGEFLITDSIIKDLNALGGVMDKVFIVFNKTDALNNNQLLELKEYINKQLERYDILKYLPCPPIYISSQNSFNARVKKEDVADTVVLLEDAIWSFLLEQNKTGLHKILSILGSSKELVEKYRNIVQLSLKNTSRHEELVIEIANVRIELRELKKYIADNRYTIISQITSIVQNSLDNVIIHLRNQLEAISLNENLPDRKAIAKYLEDNIYRIISQINVEFQQAIYNMQTDVNQWISLKLKQIELSIQNENEYENPQMLSMDVTKYTAQVFSFFQEPSSGYIGILESIVGFVGDVIGTIVEKIGQAFTADVKVRRKEISSICVKAEKGHRKIHKEFIDNINSQLTSICFSVEQKSIDRTNVYLASLNAQIGGLENTISKGKKNSYKSFLEELSTISDNIESCWNYLKDYSDSIEWKSKG